MKAVIEIQWHQYIVSAWDMLVVDQLEGKPWDAITLDTVLLVFDEEGKNVSVGTPYVKDVSVSTKLVEHTKWSKIKVVKFQSKKRYHKTRGFTPLKTVLSIEKINA